MSDPLIRKNIIIRELVAINSKLARNKCSWKDKWKLKRQRKQLLKDLSEIISEIDNWR